MRASHGRKALALWTLGAVLALGGLTAGFVMLDRMENVPAWLARPERIEPKRQSNGLMTQSFADALFASVLTDREYRQINLVAEGKGAPRDVSDLRYLLGRYIGKADAFGFSRAEAERQFYWSASGCYDDRGFTASGQSKRRLFETSVQAPQTPA